MKALLFSSLILFSISANATLNDPEPCLRGHCPNGVGGAAPASDDEYDRYWERDRPRRPDGPSMERPDENRHRDETRRPSEDRRRDEYRHPDENRRPDEYRHGDDDKPKKPSEKPKPDPEKPKEYDKDDEPYQGEEKPKDEDSQQDEETYQDDESQDDNSQRRDYEQRDHQADCECDQQEDHYRQNDDCDGHQHDDRYRRAPRQPDRRVDYYCDPRYPASCQNAPAPPPAPTVTCYARNQFGVQFYGVSTVLPAAQQIAFNYCYANSPYPSTCYAAGCYY